MRILVLANDASRTGAPRVLVDLLRWAHRHLDVELDVLVRRDGPLVAELAGVAHVKVLAPPDGWSRSQLAAHGLGALGLHRAALAVEGARARFVLRRRPRPDVVYLSSLPAIGLLEHLRWPDVPVVVHVHELDGVVQTLRPEALELLRHRVDLVVAASAAVEAMLVGRVGVEPERVVRHLEALDPRRMEGPRPGEDPAAAAGIPAGATVALAVGTAGRRKGADLFVQLAVALRRRGGGPRHLVWVGAEDPEAELWPPAHDAEAAGLSTTVHLVGEVDDVGPWMRRADLFVLPSREDPLPVVALEAGWWATPTVAFDSGGVAELLGRDGEAGLVVPPLDVDALADATVSVLDDPGMARRLAAEARRRVQAHHVVDHVAPRLWSDVLGQVVAP